METELLIDKINEFTNNEYKFELKSAVLDTSADFCVIEIYYRDGILLEIQKKQEFETYMESILPSRFKYEFKFVKKFISEERIFDDLKVFMKRNFPSIFYKIDSVLLLDDVYKISLIIDEITFEHAKKKRVNEKVCEYFKSNFEDKNFDCELKIGQVFNAEIQEDQEDFEEDDSDMMSLRKIEVSEIIEFVGEKIEQTADYIKDKIGERKNIIAMVKANAYGVGDTLIANELQNMGIKNFGVACIDEAIRLRNNNITGMILVTSVLVDKEIESAIEEDISISVSNIQNIKDINEIAKQKNKIAKIHIKIDTGMTRLGFSKDNIIINFTNILKYKNIEIEDYLQKRINQIDEFILEQEKQGKKVYVLDAEAAIYMIPINKYNKDYDMFLKGNIGKDGEEGQIEKIKQKDENTIYLIKRKGLNLNWQTPLKVIEYIRENLKLTGEISIYEIYQ